MRANPGSSRCGYADDNLPALIVAIGSARDIRTGRGVALMRVRATRQECRARNATHQMSLRRQSYHAAFSRMTTVVHGTDAWHSPALAVDVGFCYYPLHSDDLSRVDFSTRLICF
jgi:hypothetical protein